MHHTYGGDPENAGSQLQTRDDPSAVRLRKLIALPDLTRKENSPVRFVVEAVLSTPELRDCDVVEIPEVVSVETNFDLLNAPADHPSRSNGDTFYIEPTHVLRTQTTAFWPYYLRDPSVVRKLEAGSAVTAVCYGKVYRRDEIDRHHYPVFHQMDGLCLCRKERLAITLKDLSGVAAQIAGSIYGSGIVCRETDDVFPFTEPSVQLEIQWQGGWLELMGAGLVHPNVLRMLGLDPAVYNGWAFGFGLDRLAMVKMSIPDIRVLWLDDPRVTSQFVTLDSTYREVSKYPPTVRDISVLVEQRLPLNRLYEAMRDCGNLSGEELIEEVRLVDRYASETFAAGTISYTFRIVYRSNTRTLTHGEVNLVQEGVRAAMVREFSAVLR